MGKQADRQKSLFRIWKEDYGDIDAHRAASWVYDFWKEGWGPAPGMDGCTLPPALTQSCLNERHKTPPYDPRRRSENQRYGWARGKTFPANWGHPAN